MRSGRLRKDVKGTKVTTELSAEKTILGDIVWVKTRNCPWWPAQVFDKNVVSGAIKPKKRFKSEVLVRLYGTYNLYVDPLKYRSEFQNTLKQNNGSYRETFEKALEEALKSGSLKRRLSEEENACVEASKSGMLEEDVIQKRSKLNSPDSVKHPPEISEGLSQRRIRVMQNLGLAAPCGSPFRKSGLVLSKV
ncbi:hypothetical protein GIB67_019628 [Kingdonia uniflora]|uniref:PWWP domain-containing protein n=1 Tax=Kingdonia uniflora TaxID=39325 RepID=A0A7J7N178_9MAGN|nr:hypothetical protein GIB67_019628 [Kingdonia uniflora]